MKQHNIFHIITLSLKKTILDTAQKHLHLYYYIRIYFQITRLCSRGNLIIIKRLSHTINIFGYPTFPWQK